MLRASTLASPLLGTTGAALPRDTERGAVMRRVHAVLAGRFNGRFARGAAAVLPLLLLASACSRSEEKRVAAPTPPAETRVREMHWIWEQEAVSAAATTAGASPLVQRALASSPILGLRFERSFVVHATGETSDGSPLRLTILPYSVQGDPTKAAFVSMAEGYGRVAAEYGEMIVGRDPRPDEPGFHPVVWGNRLVWIRSGEAFEPGTSSGQPAPMKRSWTKLFDCVAERMPTGCAAGSAIAEEVAPGYPHAAAVGCGIGAALGAGSCVADFIRDR